MNKSIQIRRLLAYASLLIAGQWAMFLGGAVKSHIWPTSSSITITVLLFLMLAIPARSTRDNTPTHR
jgi:hypothetical protein